MKHWAASVLCFSSIFCSIYGQSTTPAPPKKSNYLYNATTSLLGLTRDLPMTVSVHQIDEKEGNRFLGKVLASVDFPDATKAKVEGSKTEGSVITKFPVKLSIPSAMEDNNIDVTTLDINFEMIHDHTTGYWNLSTMDISLIGKMKSNCSDVGCDLNLNSSMNVAPKRGYTSLSVDVNCQRGYTTCAPVNLCWTCYDHQIEAVIEKESKVGISILIPGMQLQPLTANGTDKFGYRWDCDPIWSSALWFSLLLGLFLIAILAWAIEMLVTLHTPSRFDDPKGKPLVVPLTD